MVALTKLKKNDLNAMGLTGTVANMKRRIRGMIRRGHWNMRRINQEQLSENVHGELARINTSIERSRAKRDARIAEDRRKAKNAKAPLWVVRVRVQIVLSGETGLNRDWRDRIYRIRAPTADLEYFRQSIIDNPSIRWAVGDYATPDVLRVEFTDIPIRAVSIASHSEIPMRADSEGFCVIRLILKCMEKVSGFKRMTWDIIHNQFLELFGEKINYGITAVQIKEWIIHYGIRASLYAITPDNRVCLTWIYHSTNTDKICCIPVIVNNNHAYLIEDDSILESIRRGHSKNIGRLMNGVVRNAGSNSEIFHEMKIGPLRTF